MLYIRLEWPEISTYSLSILRTKMDERVFSTREGFVDVAGDG